MYTSLHYHYSITEISSEIMELPSTIQLTINSNDNDCKEKKIIEQPTMDDRSIVTDNVFSQFATSSAIQCNGIFMAPGAVIRSGNERQGRPRRGRKRSHCPEAEATIGGLRTAGNQPTQTLIWFPK